MTWSCQLIAHGHRWIASTNKNKNNTDVIVDDDFLPHRPTCVWPTSWLRIWLADVSRTCISRDKRDKTRKKGHP